MENENRTKNLKEEQVSSSWWPIGRWFSNFRKWREKQEVERSRESNGRLRGSLTAHEARNLTMYGQCVMSLDDAILAEVCSIEDQINFKGEQHHDTYIATSIEYLDVKVREGIIKHFKEKGFKVYKTTLEGHPDEKTLIIDWTPNTKDEEKLEEEKK